MRKWHVEHRAEFDALVAAGHGEFRALRAKAKAESADIVPKEPRFRQRGQQSSSEKKGRGRTGPTTEGRVHKRDPHANTRIGRLEIGVQQMGANTRKGRREIRAQEKKVEAVLRGLESMGLE
jgi:hypothetical protein